MAGALSSTATNVRVRDNSGFAIGGINNSTVKIIFDQNVGKAARDGETEVQRLAGMLMESLSTEDSRLNIKIATPGTNQWFLRTSEFCSWQQELSSALFWFSASPGCGKSVLCRYLVDSNHLSQRGIVAHFFFRSGLDGRTTAADALASIIHQILVQHPQRDELILYAISRFRNHFQKYRQRLDELWFTLLDIAKDKLAGPIIVILDALDECEEKSRRDLLDRVTKWPDDDDYTSASLKIFLSSRRYESLDATFRKLRERSTFIELDGNRHAEDIAGDINLVLEHEVQELFTSRREQSRHKIFNKLRIGHQRTYLWLSLTLDWLHALDAAEEKLAVILQKLDTLPENVNVYYNAILDRSPNRSLAVVILSIILASTRPMTLQEVNVAQALWSLDPMLPISLENVELFADGNLRAKIENLCGLFVQVYDDRVYLIHQTAREFLLLETMSDTSNLANRLSWQGCIDLAQAHSDMANVLGACIDAITEADEAEEWEFRTSLQQYAMEEWPYHCRATSDSLQQQLLKLAYRLCDKAASTWLEAFSQNAENRLVLRDSTNVLAVAANLGWSDLVEYICQTCDEIHDRKAGSTSLSVAINRDYILHKAAMKGSLSIIRPLVKAGAEINCPAYRRQMTPLHYAAREGHLDVVTELLQSGSDLHALDTFCSSALHYAAQFCHETIVHVLLEAGANTAVTDFNRYTPLHHAVDRGSVAISEMLIKFGADIHTNLVQGNYSILHMAVRHGHGTLTKVLIDAGAEVEARTTSGRTPLHLSSDRGDAHIIKTLLQAGANINAQDNDGRTPLHLCAVVGVLWRTASATKTLVEAGADLNAKDNEGNTPIHLAASLGKEKPFRLLQEAGADLFACNENNETALSLAKASNKINIDSITASIELKSLPSGAKRPWSETQ